MVSISISRSISISVVIPLFNKGPHIRKTIESVFAQNISPCDIIVVDDGSTDGGAEIVTSIFGDKVKLISQKNQGESAARNSGLLHSSCDYVAFLDADDWWEPNHLEVLSNLIKITPDCALWSTGHLIFREGEYFKPSSSYCDGWMGQVDDFFLRYSQGLSLVNSITACVRRDALIDLGGFPVGVRKGPDIITWIKLALRYPVGHAEIATAVYNQAAVNRTDKLREKKAPGSLLFIAAALASESLSAKNRKGLLALFDSIAFFTAAGFRLNNDRIGFKSIAELSCEIGRWRTWLKIIVIKIVPVPLLLMARRMRHKPQA